MATEKCAKEFGDSSAASLKIVPKDYAYPLLEDPQGALTTPTEGGRTLVTRGGFNYFHYGCDGHQDAGLGELRSYFEKYQGFVAMGGLSDTASKAITGYHCSARGRIFLQVVVSQRISSFYELVN